MSQVISYPRAILGWREWEVCNGELWPLFWNDSPPWPADPMIPSRCERDQEHSPPVSGCGCGFHAWWEPEGLVGWRRIGGSHKRLTRVAGAIAAAGRVELHADGFRAELAQIVCLVESGSLADRAAQRDVAKRRGVKIFRSRGLAKRYARGIASPLDELLKPAGGLTPRGERAVKSLIGIAPFSLTEPRLRDRWPER